MKPVAIGYLRSDVSKTSKVWHQIQIRSLARRFGYDLAKIIEFSEFTADPVDKLIGAVRRCSVEAVFTPSPEHFGGVVPEELVAVVDVVTVAPETTHSRQLPAVF